MNKFETGLSYKSPRTGREYNCVFSDEKIAVLKDKDTYINIEHSVRYLYEEIPTKKTGWINIFNLPLISGLYPTKEAALKAGGSYAVACIEIEYFEGEGL